MLSSRKKSCYFKRNNIQEIDYKDVKLLTKFINDQGKITADLEWFDLGGIFDQLEE